MTKLSAEQIAKNILQKRIKIKSDLHAWCEHALQPLGMVPAKHHKIIIQALEEVERGDCDRLIISLPPGSAKSTYASVLFPAWFLAALIHHMAAIRWRMSHKPLILLKDWVSRPLHSPDHTEPHPPCPTL